jgi:hypothetical protein
MMVINNGLVENTLVKSPVFVCLIVCFIWKFHVEKEKNGAYHKKLTSFVLEEYVMFSLLLFCSVLTVTVTS